LEAVFYYQNQVKVLLHAGRRQQQAVYERGKVFYFRFADLAVCTY
jgi:hypothetical protein